MKTWKIVICAVVLVFVIAVAANALTKNSTVASNGSTSLESSSDQSAEIVGEGCPKKSSDSKSTEKSCPKSSKKGCPKSSDKSSPKK